MYLNSFLGKKLKVRLNDKGSNPFEGETLEKNQAVKIYDLCSGNHTMYMQRRTADTLEIQQMKEQKRESERHKAMNREVLLREIKAREEIQKSQQETLVKYKELQSEMETYKNDLDEARRTIVDLERQLRELQVIIYKTFSCSIWQSCMGAADGDLWRINDHFYTIGLHSWRPYGARNSNGLSFSVYDVPSLHN